MPYVCERVNGPDDPRRCQGSTPSGPCNNIAIDGATLCPRCAGPSQQRLTAETRNVYLRTNPEYRLLLEEFSGSDATKTLNWEVEMGMVLLAEHVRAMAAAETKSPAALMAAEKMLQTISVLKTKNQILSQNVGQLYTRESMLQIVHAFVQIAAEEVKSLVGGEEAVDRIRDRCYHKANTQRNAEQTRGLRAIEKE